MERAAADAPSELLLVRDLVNTVEWQEDDETWETPADLASWMAARQMTVARLEPADVLLARRLREGARELLLRNAGHEFRRSAVAEFDDALSRVPLVLRLGADGRPTVSAPPHDGPHPLSPLVIALHAARTHPGWHRVKACSRDSCRWAYWDASRNGSARWCSMSGCGTHLKNQRRNDPGAALSHEIARAAGAPRAATLVDVASRAGVSIKTVSNVVTSSVRVSEATRARVQDAIDELHYRPNLVARDLRTGRHTYG